MVEEKEKNQGIELSSMAASLEGLFAASSDCVQYSASVTGNAIQVSSDGNPPKLFTVAKDVKIDSTVEEKMPPLLNSTESQFLSSESNFLRTTSEPVLLKKLTEPDCSNNILKLSNQLDSSEDCEVYAEKRNNIQVIDVPIFDRELQSVGTSQSLRGVNHNEVDIASVSRALELLGKGFLDSLRSQLVSSQNLWNRSAKEEHSFSGHFSRERSVIPNERGIRESSLASQPNHFPPPYFTKLNENRFPSQPQYGNFAPECDSATYWPELRRVASETNFNDSSSNRLCSDGLRPKNQPSNQYFASHSNPESCSSKRSHASITRIPSPTEIRSDVFHPKNQPSNQYYASHSNPESCSSERSHTSITRIPSPTGTRFPPIFTKLRECPEVESIGSRFTEKPIPYFTSLTENRDSPFEQNNSLSCLEKPFSSIPDLPDNYRFPFKKNYENNTFENIQPVVTEESSDDLDFSKDCRVDLVRVDSKAFRMPPNVRWINRASDVRRLREARHPGFRKYRSSLMAKESSLKLRRNRLCSSDSSSESDEDTVQKTYKVRGPMRPKMNLIKSDSEEDYTSELPASESERTESADEIEKFNSLVNEAERFSSTNSHRKKIKAAISSENKLPVAKGKVGPRLIKAAKSSENKLPVAKEIDGFRMIKTAISSENKFPVVGEEDGSRQSGDQNSRHSKYIDDVLFDSDCDTLFSSCFWKNSGVTEDISQTTANNKSDSCVTEESGSNKSEHPPYIKQPSNECQSLKPKKRMAGAHSRSAVAVKRPIESPGGEKNERNVHVHIANKSKKLRKALLTDPKPMEKRPKYARGREEWFEERISESSSSTLVQEAVDPPKKQSHPPTSQTKDRTTNHSSGANADRPLKGFKIPKRCKDAPKEQKGAGPQKEPDPPSSKEKKTTKVPRRSDKCSSRMAFLTDTNVWKVKPVCRSNVVNNKQAAEENKPKSQEKREPYVDRSKRGLEILKNVCSKDKARKSGDNLTKKRVRFSDGPPEEFRKARERACLEKSSNQLAVKPSNLKKSVPVIDPSYRTQKPQEIDERQIHLTQYFPIVSMHVKWSPRWLVEQKESTKPPPLVPEIREAPLSFENFDTYFSMMQSLVILNIWDSMYKESKHLFRSEGMSWKSFQVLVVSQVEKHGILEVECEAAVGEDVSYVPSTGDSILLAAESKKRSVENLMFGFITSHRPVMFDEVSDASDWQSVPKSWLDGAKFHLFTAYIKRQKKSLSTRSLLPANGICNTQMKMHAMEYLFKFQNAPLIETVLHPAALGAMSDFTKLKKDSKDFVQAMCTEVTENGDPKIFLVQGLPGSGKTHLILSAIEKLLYDCSPKTKVFVCAPSHAAADEVGLRLVDLVERSTWRGKAVKFVRIGDLKKISPKLLECHIETQVERTVKIRKRKEQEIEGRIKELELRMANEINCTEALYPLARQLGETKEHLRQTMGQNWKLKVLDESDVIISTVSDFREYNSTFPSNHTVQPNSCCIVDDACQCSEPELLQCLTCGVRNLVLVGDSKQFITGVSRRSLSSRSHRSMFDRLYAAYRDLPESPLLILNEQHRMHSEISRFASFYFFKNKLKPSNEVDEEHNLFPLKPYVILDISSDCDKDAGEQDKLLTKMAAFLAETVPSASIGVITRESDVATHRKILSCFRDIEVDSVEGFRGREKDVIVLSVTPSCGLDDFAVSEEKQCISLTRSRKTLIVYGHVSGLRGCRPWSSLLDNAKARGAYVSVPSLEEKHEAAKTFLEFIIKPC